MYLNALENTFVQSDWTFYYTNEFSLCYFLDYRLMGELNHHNLTLKKCKGILFRYCLFHQIHKNFDHAIQFCLNV